MPTPSQKNVQTHGEGPRRGWAGDIGLNFVFLLFVFVHFLADQPKTKTKTTSSDPWRGTQERLDSRHRSELFVFLTLVGLNFLFFLCVSIVFRSYFSFAIVYIALSLQKPAFLQSTPLHPPWLPLLYIYICIAYTNIPHLYRPFLAVEAAKVCPVPTSVEGHFPALC